jgi:hypothetical protein
MLETLLIWLWFISGWVSMAYWWTRKYNLTTHELFMIFFCGFIGPVAFLLGWSSLGTGFEPKVLLKRRK